MAKRRLSDQQRTRINKRVRADKTALGNAQRGVVVAHHGKSVDILPGELFDTDIDIGTDISTDIEKETDTSETNTKRSTLRAKLRAKLPLLTCGDRVLWQADKSSPGYAIIEQLEERGNLLARPRPYSDPKPVVANIDLIIIVIAAAPEPIGSLIDRYLIAAEQIDVEVAIVINKVDLLTDSEQEPQTARLQELEELAELYRQLEYPIYYSAAKPEQGVAANTVTQLGEPFSALVKKLDGKTCILAGQSGVGKSSLINFLAGSERAATGEISSSNAKGVHTTTHSQLHILGVKQPSDAADQAQTNSASEHSADKQDINCQLAIVDSPGIREFGLWHLSEEAIIDGMRDFRRFASQCRFRDCDHKNSQGCEVQRALASGAIHPRRAASYSAIMESLEAN